MAETPGEIEKALRLYHEAIVDSMAIDGSGKDPEGKETLLREAIDAAVRQATEQGRREGIEWGYDDGVRWAPPRNEPRDEYVARGLAALADQGRGM